MTSGINNVEASQVPYGALDYYQVHYIVEAKKHPYDADYIFLTVPILHKGSFGNKKDSRCKMARRASANINYNVEKNYRKS